MCTIDPGNIMDRGDREHYTSEPIHLRPEEILKSVEWEGHCTSSSWVELEVRTADREENLAHSDWQRINAGADLRSMNLHGIVQYRLALCAKCACGTPRITKVILNCEEA